MRAAHLRLRKYAKCSVETLYLSEMVGALASSTSVSGTRVSIMTSATSEAVAVAGRAEAAPSRSAIVANAARGTLGVVKMFPFELGSRFTPAQHTPQYCCTARGGCYASDLN